MAYDLNSVIDEALLEYNRPKEEDLLDTVINEAITEYNPPPQTPYRDEKISQGTIEEPGFFDQSVQGVKDFFTTPEEKKLQEIKPDFSTVPVEEQVKAQIELDAKRAGLPVEKYKRKLYPQGDPARRVKQTAKSTLSGVLGTAESAAGGIQWITDGAVGKDFADTVQGWREELQADNPDIIDEVASGIGSSLIFFLPGMGVARGANSLAAVTPRLAAWLGAGVSAGMEAFTEAGGTYRDVLQTAENAAKKAGDAYSQELQRTRDIEKANGAATKTFWMNLPLLMLTNKMSGLFESKLKSPLKLALSSAGSEAIEEGSQNIIGNIAKDEDIDYWEALHSGTVGAISSGILGAGIGAVSNLPATRSKFNDFVKGKTTELQTVPFEETEIPTTEEPVQDGVEFVVPEEEPTAVTPEEVEVNNFNYSLDNLNASGQFDVNQLTENFTSLYSGFKNALLGKDVDEFNDRIDNQIVKIFSDNKKIIGKLIQTDELKKFLKAYTSPQEEIPARPVPAQKFKKIKFDHEKHSLTDFVRLMGGVIADDKFAGLVGETNIALKIKDGGYNLVNKNTGRSLDTLRMAAAEEGFQVPDTDAEFLSLIVDDIAAKKQDEQLKRVWTVHKDYNKLVEAEALNNFYPEGYGEEETEEYSASERPGAETGDIENKKKTEITVYASPTKVNPKTGNFETRVIRTMELPEIVEIAQGLREGKYPTVKKLLLGRPTVQGLFGNKKGIQLQAALFSDPKQTQYVVAHELGHLVDKLPDNISSRGNILGRIATLKKHLKGMYEGMNNSEIRNELKNLTMTLSPFDPFKNEKYTKYRYKPNELYAEGFSALLHDPVLLKEKAPGFLSGFLKYLNKKPEAKAVYEDIQKRLGNKTEIFNKRFEIQRSGYERGEKIKADNLEQEKRPFWDDTLERYVDLRHEVLKKVKQADKTGLLLAKDNPEYAYDNVSYMGSEVKEYLREVNEGSIHDIQKRGMKPEDVADILFHERVINERGDIANPGGYNPKTSQDYLDSLKNRVGKDNYSALETAVNNFRKVRKETVIPVLKEANMYDPELMEKLEDNEHYAAFSVVDHIENKFGRDSGIAQIYRQIGTLKQIENPFTKTVVKDIALLKAARLKIAEAKTIKMMQEFFPSEIQDAKTGWNGTAHVPVNPREDNKGLVQYLEGGKLKGFYLEKNLANSLALKPDEISGLVDLLRKTNTLWREVFVQKNPGFFLFNIIRDYRRAVTNLPGASIKSFTPEYIKAIKPAFKDTFGIAPDVVREMNKKHMLVSVESARGISAEDTEIERLLQKNSLSPKKWDNSITKPFKKLFDAVEGFGEAVEKVPKIAGYTYLTDKTSLPEEKIQHIVRTRAGSPDFLRKGKSYNRYNNILLFGNAIKEGMRGDIEAFKENPGDYATKTVMYNLMPKLVMFMAAKGLLGKDNEDAIRNTSEYDKANYSIIPLGKTESGKSVILRIPSDEGGRLAGGIFWKTINLNNGKDFLNLLEYASGQAPTFSPTLSTISDFFSYAIGRNPYDFFRGRKAIPEGIFEAGGVRSLKAFGKYLANKSGVGIIQKFDTNDVETIKTQIEKDLNIPGVMNTIGRFIKVTDQGRSEEYREAVSGGRKEKINTQLDVNDAIADAINSGKTLPAHINKLYKKLVTDKLIVGGAASMKAFARKFKRKQSYQVNLPEVRAIRSARSNAEKIKLLNIYEKKMVPAKFKSLTTILVDDGLLSVGAVKEFYKNRGGK